jgi:hypothetical protein
MSRRRGWEDAYLDYASLRLLLTQIEAVYEEEDLKRGGSAQNTIDGIGGSREFDHESFGDLDRTLNEEEGGGSGDGGNWVGSVWRKTQNAIFGDQTGWNGHRRYNSNRRRRVSVRKQQNHRQQWGGALDWDEHGNVNEGSNWVMSYISPNPRPRVSRRNKKDKTSNALDKGGWRSPGVTDYRDELFFESDDDIAFGYCSEDEEDWEDIDDAESYCEQQGGEYYNIEYDAKDSQEHEELEQEANLFILDEGTSNSQNSLGKVDDGRRGELESDEPMSYRDCESPQRPIDSDDYGETRGLLETPDSKVRQTSINYDSPGLLESRYETLAVGGTNQGSPSEDGKWLGFIPNLFAGGNKSKQQHQSSDSDREDALFHNDSDDNIQDSPLASISQHQRVDDSPHRYTHFSESFVSNDSATNRPPLPPSGSDEGTPSSQLRFRSEPHLLTSESGEDEILTTPLTTNHKTVTATAIGSAMPRTPLTPPPMTPLSPVFEHRKDEEFEVKEQSRGGFGVSLNSALIPNESTSLLTPSTFRAYGQSNFNEQSPNRVSQVQFYSFQNSDDGGMLVSQEKEEPIGQGEDGGRSVAEGQRGGDAAQRGSSNNMISYYSAHDGYFSLRSPTRNQYPQNSQQHHHNNAQPRMRMPSLSEPPKPRSWPLSTDNSESFVLNFLFGGCIPLGKADAVKKSLARGKSAVPSNDFKRANGHHQQSRQRAQTANVAKRKRARARRQRRLRRQREKVPDHLRVAHIRAAGITERFRGLLRAEVEKVILFANSRLGELSDTIGSLRYASYEGDNAEVRTKYPHLDDGGMHENSSSDDEEGDIYSCASSSSGEQHRRNGLDDSEHLSARDRAYQNDSSNKRNASTRRQIVLRDREYQYVQEIPLHDAFKSHAILFLQAYDFPDRCFRRRISLEKTFHYSLQ